MYVCYAPLFHFELIADILKMSVRSVFHKLVGDTSASCHVGKTGVRKVTRLFIFALEEATLICF